jgi:hypothetical protein
VKYRGSYQKKLRPGAVLAGLAMLSVAASIDASAQDIVGVWVGQAAQPDQKDGATFPVRLTFVSPTGGISRYPSEPICGGMLVGDQKGDLFEYQETITYGGKNERADGCIPGTKKLTVDGDTMKYEWSSTYEGQDYASTGELQRVAGSGKSARSRKR